MHGTMSQKSDTFTRIWQFALETGAADWFARALAFISGRAAADAMRHRGWKAAGRKRLASSAVVPHALSRRIGSGSFFLTRSSTGPEGMPRAYPVALPLAPVIVMMSYL